MRNKDGKRSAQKLFFLKSDFWINDNKINKRNGRSRYVKMVEFLWRSRNCWKGYLNITDILFSTKHNGASKNENLFWIA